MDKKETGTVELWQNLDRETEQGLWNRRWVVRAAVLHGETLVLAQQVWWPCGCVQCRARAGGKLTDLASAGCFRCPGPGWTPGVHAMQPGIVAAEGDRCSELGGSRIQKAPPPHLLRPCAFPSLFKTKDVQKAMDDRRFEEAIQLRGRCGCCLSGTGSVYQGGSVALARAVFGAGTPQEQLRG